MTTLNKNQTIACKVNNGLALVKPTGNNTARVEYNYSPLCSGRTIGGPLGCGPRRCGFDSHPLPKVTQRICRTTSYPAR